MINSIFIFFASLFLVIRGANMATKYAAISAETYSLSKYTVGFIIIAIISVLPEMLISINSAIEGLPEFGLGMLFGSNIADLSLIFAIIVISTGRQLKIESKILKNQVTYPFVLLLPLLLGLDGYFSRAEGIVLIITGAVFYYVALKNGADGSVIPTPSDAGRMKSLSMLLLSMVIMLAGAHFIVTSATSIATYIGINPILIGMLIVGLGTTMPELFFSLRSVKKQDDSLAIGDILGTVLADATVIVGIIALISPFDFPVRIVYITGIFMIVASLILFRFMRTEKVISKIEAYLLLAFWMSFVIVEFIANIKLN